MSRGSVRHLAVVTALTTSLVGAVAAPAVAASAESAAPRSVAAPPAAKRMKSTVDGRFTDAAGRTGRVRGTFTPTRFTKRGNQVLATGKLAATMVDSSGKQVGTATRTVTVPLRRPRRTAHSMLSCQVLDLTLGPRNIDLAGRPAHLDRVHVDLTAGPGAANLLGNLLCAVAGLLNGPGVQTELVDDLNTILGLLNG